jgi:hypothetical protein
LSLSRFFNVRYKLVFLAALVFVACMPDAARGAREIKIKNVAVIPFGVFKIGGDVIDVTQMVTEDMQALGYDVLNTESLEDFMIQRRIRRPEFLDRSLIRTLGEAKGVDALVLGFAVITVERGVPKATINAQMVDCHEVSVLWAKTVSITGDDYETILGLGKVRSALELTRRAVDELLEDLPTVAEVTETSMPPFEVIRTSFSPEVSQGGNRVKIFVEIKEITGEVAEVVGVFQGREIKLGTENNVLYSANIIAPASEDSYPLELKIKDVAGRLYQVQTSAVLTVHNTPPRVVLSLREKAISPGDDGINDHVLIVPEVLHHIGLRRWTIEIYNENGDLVRFDDGLGETPEALIWRGEDDKGNLVPDGRYFCRMVVTDEAGNEDASQDKEIMVDSTAPEVEVFLEKRTDEGLVLKVDSFEMTSVLYWELSVYDEHRITRQSFSGQGALPETLDVPIERKQGDANQELAYRYDITAKDAVGNRLNRQYQVLEKLRKEEDEIPITREIWIEDF